jgi:Holliday junction resolvasome RuvABC DNA-binding subunit
MNPQQAYKLFSQALTAANSIRTLVRSSSAILKAFQPKVVNKAVSKTKVKESSTQKPDLIDHIKAEQLKGALVNMGFGKDESYRTVQELITRDDFNSHPLPYLLREALGLLHK